MPLSWASLSATIYSIIGLLYAAENFARIWRIDTAEPVDYLVGICPTRQ